MHNLDIHCIVHCSTKPIPLGLCESETPFSLQRTTPWMESAAGFKNGPFIHITVT